MLGFRSGRYEAAFAVALVTTAWSGGLLRSSGGVAATPYPSSARATCPATTPRESRERLALLAEVSQDFAATPDLDETLEGVTRRIATELGRPAPSGWSTPPARSWCTSPPTTQAGTPGRSWSVCSTATSALDQGLAASCSAAASPACLERHAATRRRRSSPTRS